MEIDKVLRALLQCCMGDRGLRLGVRVGGLAFKAQTSPKWPARKKEKGQRDG